MSFDLGMAIAALPFLGYVYPALPFAFLQLLLCYNLRGRFSRLLRLLPLIAVAAIYLVMVVFFTWLVGRLERRLRNSER